MHVITLAKIISIRFDSKQRIIFLFFGNQLLDMHSIHKIINNVPKVFLITFGTGLDLKGI